MKTILWRCFCSLLTVAALLSLLTVTSLSCATGDDDDDTTGGDTDDDDDDAAPADGDTVWQYCDYVDHHGECILEDPYQSAFVTCDQWHPCCAALAECEAPFWSSCHNADDYLNDSDCRSKWRDEFSVCFDQYDACMEDNPSGEGPGGQACREDAHPADYFDHVQQAQERDWNFYPDCSSEDEAINTGGCVGTLEEYEELGRIYFGADRACSLDEACCKVRAACEWDVFQECEHDGLSRTECKNSCLLDWHHCQVESNLCNGLS
ncbi:MAG: hypothetical protein H6684_04395 [Deltaproteobacteria bacterium]|nr:hypothetical protein [Deltaproteobacteria bacterium]